MTDEHDVVIGIAASLYASRATNDALRAEPNLEALASEAWDLYFELQRAVSGSHGEALRRANAGELGSGRAESKQ
jgi:hypothetical protein